jgi:hypothetical protein
MKITRTFARLLASGPTSQLILAGTIALAGGTSAYLNRPPVAAHAPATTTAAACGNHAYHFSVSLNNGTTYQGYTCDPTGLLSHSATVGATVELEPPY